MKSIRLYIVAVFLSVTSFAYAQDQSFVFTLYGGLFFPSNVNFRTTYQSSSDLIWGGGICLPMRSSLFAMGDISFFKAKVLVDPSSDSTLELSERFIHIGILSKQPLGGNIFIRLCGGLSFSTIKQTTLSPRSPEQSVESDKRVGYFGGVGLEEPIDNEGHISLFGDVVYDYRRSLQKELYGDFGGIRVILGFHLFLF